MSDDDSARLLADLEELRARADSLRRRLSAGHDPRSRYPGEDRNGLARVIVDGHGRATEVVTARDWRGRTDPAGLARALVTATAEAQARRLEAWGAGAAHPAPLPDHTPLPGSLEATGADLIRDLLPVLERAERQLDGAGRRLERHFVEKAELTDGALTITTEGGQVTGIDFDDRWIGSAAADEVAHRVCRLLQQAHDRAWTGIGDLLPRELRDVLLFAADPERMLRQLGFPG